jgi:MarR family transcriptional regulator, organic hydroperoxide resistance regulator
MADVSFPLFRAIVALQGERPGEVLDILRLMWTIEHDLNVLSQRMEGHQGIPGSHRAVLRYVALFPGISASKLAELLQLHPSTLSGVFKQLISKNLLQRREDPDDARRARLYPTPTGMSVLGESMGTVDAVIERVVARSTPAELNAAREVLQRLAFELQAELGTNGSRE